MISDQIKQAEDAARFLTRVLTGFPESSIYEDYKAAEHFTDGEFEQAIETLTEFGNGPAVTERPAVEPCERLADFGGETCRTAGVDDPCGSCQRADASDRLDFAAQRVAERQTKLRHALEAKPALSTEGFDQLSQKTRADWHEPDEQEISAIVIGRTLDNAFGDTVMDGDDGEFNVVLFHYGEPVCVRNLATLLAEASAYRRAIRNGLIKPEFR